ncbi:hypothetical protein [Morganella morganii]|uniref:hypothetical protein n=1 Tax=Morganella morganii TaxID=582 RepID=UPI001FFC53FD|nr:hypothetical protein [Morganella morganii]
MEPANNAISDKVNACAVYTYNNKPPKKHISLSIGKNYPLITPLELVGRKLESFFIKHKETSALYYTYGDATDDRLTLEEDKYTISTGEKKTGHA